MAGMFLEDGINDVQEQKERELREAAAKRKEGFVKVRAIDPLANKMTTVWVKKDQPTIDFENEQKKKDQIEKREKQLAHRAKMADMAKKVKELDDQEAEIAKLEAELLDDAEQEILDAEEAELEDNE